MDFDNQMTLKKNGQGEYRIDWDSTLIFPSLLEEYRVSVDTGRRSGGRFMTGWAIRLPCRVRFLR